MHTFYESVSVLEECRGVTSIESKEAAASSLFRNQRWKRVSLTAIAGLGGGERERTTALWLISALYCTHPMAYPGEGDSGCLSRVSVAIMRHLSIISYNSKAVATSQLKFSVHKQLLIGADCGYFNFFTTSSIF